MDSNGQGQGGYYEPPQQDSSYMYEPEPEAAPPPQHSRRSSQAHSEQVRDSFGVRKHVMNELVMIRGDPSRMIGHGNNCIFETNLAAHWTRWCDHLITVT